MTQYSQILGAAAATAILPGRGPAPLSPEFEQRQAQTRLEQLGATLRRTRDEFSLECAREREGAMRLLRERVDAIERALDDSVGQ